MRKTPVRELRAFFFCVLGDCISPSQNRCDPPADSLIYCRTATVSVPAFTPPAPPPSFATRHPPPRGGGGQSGATVPTGRLLHGPGHLRDVHRDVVPRAAGRGTDRGRQPCPFPRSPPKQPSPGFLFGALDVAWNKGRILHAKWVCTGGDMQVAYLLFFA